MLLHFFRKFILASLLLFMVTSATQAQGNLPYVDGKLFHFGFSLGFNAMDAGIVSLGTVLNGKVYNVAISDLQPGFSVGMIGDMRLNRYLNLRCTPTLHFGSRVLSYTTDNNITNQTINLTSIPISVPVYLKYSSERKDNYRPYLIWGLGSSIDLAAGDQTKQVQLTPLNFYTEFGVGCDIYFSFFKLAPEIKFALGFDDIMNHTPVLSNQTDIVYSQAISRLTSRVVTLTFNFE